MPNMSFLYDTFSRNLFIISFLLSILAFFLFKKVKSNKRYAFVYLHVLLLALPFVYLAFQTGCRAYFAGCNDKQVIISLLFFALISSFIAALFIVPLIFIKRYKKKSRDITDNPIANIIHTLADKINLKKIKVYLIDTAQPTAFSFSFWKKKIFISVGMIDILKRKEIESVLLHELGHIKNNSSLSKFSHLFMKFLSPLSYFTSIEDNIDQEERDADNFVFEVQQTWKYLNSAKKKSSQFSNSIV